MNSCAFRNFLQCIGVVDVDNIIGRRGELYTANNASPIPGKP